MPTNVVMARIQAVRDNLAANPQYHKTIVNWVRALRSGQYDQGRRTLVRLHDRTTDAPLPRPQYCCLGVLCELEYQAGRLSRKLTLSASRYTFGEGQDTAVLPQELIAIFYSGNPVVLSNGEGIHLTELNDDRQLSFHQIADLIEATYLTDLKDNHDGTE